jgi:hypothetical protein
MELNDKFKGLESKLKIAGATLITLVLSGIIAAGALSMAVAGIALVVALFVNNFLVPVAARTIALWRQKALTGLAEHYSEETIMEDERQEQVRFEEKRTAFVSHETELTNVIDNLERAYKLAQSEEEQIMISQQIKDLTDIIRDEKEAVLYAAEALKELKRQNQIFISLGRAAKAKLSADGKKRNAEQMQAVVNARNKIKSNFRSAISQAKLDSSLRGMETDIIDVSKPSFVASIQNNPSPTIAVHKTNSEGVVEISHRKL